MTLIELEALASEKLSINDEESRANFLQLLNTGLFSKVIESLLSNRRECNPPQNHGGYL